jgi:protein-L-isoaspartate(D-aspartate) O-methyltransferase
MRRGVWLVVGLSIAAACSGGASLEPGPGPDRADERLQMVADHIANRGISDPNVLAALRTVPRHRFVPEAYESQAYENHPLPIGSGQTISQPFIVGLMSEALEVEPGDKVLEIGTGSGYQAAVLAAIGLEVYTIEIIPELATRAAGVLDELGYDVTVRTADGYFGWEEHAPFDAIIVTAAPDHVPHPLIQQLRPGGRMVIPVGPIGAVQTLWRFTVDESGEVGAENLGAVRFVPFTRAGE